MPKANLSITRKSDKELGVIETYGLKRVTSWTKKELAELQEKSRLPICVPLQNGDYVVATYHINKISNICWKVEDFEFTDKRSAIFYCALMHCGKLEDAIELHKVDSRVGRYDSDKALFRVRLDNSHKSDDAFKVDLYSCRFEETKGKLKQAKEELEDLIQSAKYYLSRLPTGK